MNANTGPQTIGSFLDSITTSAMWERVGAIAEHRADIRTMLWMLGDGRRSEWLHSLGMVGDAELRAMAPPIPPVALREIVAAPEEEIFLWTGMRDICHFLELNEQHTKVSRVRPRVLDFGCGCGRLTRFLGMSDRFETLGCDLNPDHVAWCQANLPNVTTRRNGPAPPLPFDDRSIEFAYLLSVFTHLSETAVMAWLADLARIIVPGGVVVITTQGYPSLHTLKSSLTHRRMFGFDEAAVNDILSRLPAEQYVFIPYGAATARVANTNTDYGSAFIAPERAFARWSGPFEIVQHSPAGLRGWQDEFVLRRR